MQRFRNVSDKITVLVDTQDPEIRITEVNRKIFTKKDLVLVIAGNINRSKGANFIEVGTVGD